MTSWNNSSFLSPRDDTCFHLPDPKFHDASLRYDSNLVTGIINAVFAPVAATTNILTIVALLKKPCLQQSSNVLLGCLALTDALVGLAVQPTYVAYRLLENKYGFVPCSIMMFYSTAFYVLYGGSFTTLCIISYERFFAVRVHGRYSKLLRVPYVLKQVSFVWFVNIALNFLQWAEINKVARGIHLALWLSCQMVSVICYGLIYHHVRRHNYLQRTRRFAHSPAARQKFRKEVKLSVGIAVIVALYFLFNLPVVLVTLYHQVVLRPIATYNFYSWSETLALLNSSINPFVCYWRNVPIRRAVLRLLRRVVREKNFVRDARSSARDHELDSRAARASVHRRMINQDTRNSSHEIRVTQWISAV